MHLITLRTAHATATVSPYGAQVMSFIPHGQPDALWRTTDDFLETALNKTKALRGGIPLCWPWFLANPADASVPSHGLGRIRIWEVTDQSATDDQATLTLALELDGTTPGWPHRTRGELIVTLTDTLTVSLTTTNLSNTPFRLTQALHTYLNVADISQSPVTDLTGLTRRHVSSGTPQPAHTGPFILSGEVEHLVSPTTALNVEDPANNRTLTVTNTGTTEFVVWNPGPEKAATLDMPPESYQNMLCLEAATLDTAPTLNPNETFTLTTTILVS